MTAAGKRHPLDDVLVANPCNIHRGARFVAQAKRPDLTAIGIRKRMLKIRCRLLDYLLSKPESSHRLHCSGRRRIPRILIHGFATEATRLVRDGEGRRLPTARYRRCPFWTSPFEIELRASLEPGLRPVFTLGRGIPDAGAPAP